jgi:hypothetical protein
MTPEQLIEKVARAICQADEQNGGPPWEYVQTLGKHPVNNLNDRARAAIRVVLEEAARQLENPITGGFVSPTKEPRRPMTALELELVNSILRGKASEITALMPRRTLGFGNAL